MHDHNITAEVSVLKHRPLDPWLDRSQGSEYMVSLFGLSVAAHGSKEGACFPCLITAEVDVLKQRLSDPRFDRSIGMRYMVGLSIHAL
jgi:hypothetical protein